MPLPVPPRMPTVFPEGMCRLTSSRIHSGLSALYLKYTWSKSMEPSAGSAAGSSAPSSVMAGTSPSTSATRLAQATVRVSIMKIMETIIRDIIIWVI